MAHNKRRYQHQDDLPEVFQRLGGTQPPRRPYEHNNDYNNLRNCDIRPRVSHFDGTNNNNDNYKKRSDPYKGDNCLPIMNPFNNGKPIHYSPNNKHNMNHLFHQPQVSQQMHVPIPVKSTFNFVKTAKISPLPIPAPAITSFINNNNNNNNLSKPSYNQQSKKQRNNSINGANMEVDDYDNQTEDEYFLMGQNNNNELNKLAKNIKITASLSTISPSNDDSSSVLSGKVTENQIEVKGRRVTVTKPRDRSASPVHKKSRKSVSPTPPFPPMQCAKRRRASSMDDDSDVDQSRVTRRVDITPSKPKSDNDDESDGEGESLFQQGKADYYKPKYKNGVDVNSRLSRNTSKSNVIVSPYNTKKITPPPAAQVPVKAGAKAPVQTAAQAPVKVPAKAPVKVPAKATVNAPTKDLGSYPTLGELNPAAAPRLGIKHIDVVPASGTSPPKKWINNLSTTSLPPFKKSPPSSATSSSTCSPTTMKDVSADAPKASISNAGNTMPSTTLTKHAKSLKPASNPINLSVVKTTGIPAKNTSANNKSVATAVQPPPSKEQKTVSSSPSSNTLPTNITTPSTTVDTSHKIIVSATIIKDNVKNSVDDKKDLAPVKYVKNGISETNTLRDENTSAKTSVKNGIDTNSDNQPQFHTPVPVTTPQQKEVTPKQPLSKEEQDRIAKELLRQLSVDERDDIVMDIMPESDTISISTSLRTSDEECHHPTVVSSKQEPTEESATIQSISNENNQDVAMRDVVDSILQMTNSANNPTAGKMTPDSSATTNFFLPTEISKRNEEAVVTKIVDLPTTQQLLSPPHGHVGVSPIMPDITMNEATGTLPAAIITPPAPKTRKRTRLPPLWKVVMSDVGDITYVNHETGEERITRPAA